MSITSYDFPDQRLKLWNIADNKIDSEKRRGKKFLSSHFRKINYGLDFINFIENLLFILCKCRIFLFAPEWSFKLFISKSPDQNSKIKILIFKFFSAQMYVPHLMLNSQHLITVKRLENLFCNKKKIPLKSW